MSAREPKKFLGTSLLIVGLGYLIINMCSLIWWYYRYLIDTSLPFDVGITFYSAVFSFAAGQNLPLSLLAMCAGGVAYPQALTPLCRTFILALSGVVVFLSGFYWATIEDYYCGQGDIALCVTEVSPVVLLILFVGAMAVAVREVHHQASKEQAPGKAQDAITSTSTGEYTLE